VLIAGDRTSEIAPTGERCFSIDDDQQRF